MASYSRAYVGVHTTAPTSWGRAGAACLRIAFCGRTTLLKGNAIGDWYGMHLLEGVCSREAFCGAAVESAGR